MPHYLLIGAGFTRNWGGPLSSEVNGSLLGDLHDDPVLSKRLREEPFESVFEGFITPAAKLSDSQRRFRDAVLNLFNRLNHTLLNATFEFGHPPVRGYLVMEFLQQFDAIFSLNQDLLLECHYLDRFPLGSRWGGAVVAGMSPRSLGHSHYEALDKVWTPTEDFNPPRRMQPLVKLHGSTNWTDKSGGPILIMGNKKSGAIDAFEVLRSSHDYFTQLLNQPKSRLMVIGYSFQDQHINNVIEGASMKNGLGTFIVDPNGSIGVLEDKNPRMRGATIGKSSRPVVEINLIGELHRPLAQVFGGDRFAHQELMRFFGR